MPTYGNPKVVRPMGLTSLMISITSKLLSVVTLYRSSSARKKPAYGNQVGLLNGQSCIFIRARLVRLVRVACFVTEMVIKITLSACANHGIDIRSVGNCLT